MTHHCSIRTVAALLLLLAAPSTCDAGEQIGIFTELWQLDQQNNGLSVTLRDQDGGWVDVNADIRLDEQGISLNPSTDSAPRPLLIIHDDQKLRSATYSTVQKLFDNYNADERFDEDQLGQNAVEDAELSAFLDAIMATKVMKRTLEYINQNDLHPTAMELDSDGFRNLIRHQWFELYTNHYGPDPEPFNSGFEHVFVGDHNRQKIGGHHFWWKFHFDQQAGKADSVGHKYKGPNGQAYPLIATFRMRWQPESGVDLREPEQKGFFVGCSPELMIAYGSLGLLIEQNNGGVPSVVELEGGRFQLTVYASTLPGNGNPELRRGDQIKSCFPKLRTVKGTDQGISTNVAQALSTADNTRIQVTGVIIAGHNEQFGLRLASSTSSNTFLAVKLPKAFRSEFNPKLSPSATGRTVVIYGRRSTYTGLPGLVDVTHVEFK